jgi:hypothetical protein
VSRFTKTDLGIKKLTEKQNVLSAFNLARNEKFNKESTFLGTLIIQEQLVIGWCNGKNSLKITFIVKKKKIIIIIIKKKCIPNNLLHSSSDFCDFFSPENFF